jgi:AbrB family looped-hinge helix DNA binding protein
VEAGGGVMSTSTLTSKGQTTIPKDVRKRLNLHPGDRLEFVIDDDGCVLGATNRLGGCNETVTFDRAASKLEDFQLL